MRKCLLFAVGLLSLTGCRHLVTSRESGLKSHELAILKDRAGSLQSAQVRLVDTGSGQTVCWKEWVTPSEPVVVPLLVPDQADSCQPMVKVCLNGGQPVVAALDTGSPLNAFHVSQALSHNLQIIDPDQLANVFQGFGGQEKLFYGMINDLAVDGLIFHHAFTGLRAQTYRQYFLGLLPVSHWEGNLIGMSSFTRLAYLTIDYPQREAIFSAQRRFPGPGPQTMVQVPFSMDSMEVVIKARFTSDSEPQLALVDTGNDAAVILPPNLIRKLGLQPLVEQGKTAKFLGIGGFKETRVFTLPHLQLGGVIFGNVEAVEGPDVFPVTLGSGFFKSYKVTLDFKQKILWLEGSSRKEDRHPDTGRFRQAGLR